MRAAVLICFMSLFSNFALAEFTTLPLGNWGTNAKSSIQTNFTVSYTQATLDLGCGTITVSEPILVDENGFFNVPASYQPGSSVEHRDGMQMPSQGAIVAGKVLGNTLELTLTTMYMNKGQWAPYTSNYNLKLGQTGTVIHCL